jgi:hypothetical protein
LEVVALLAAQVDRVEGAGAGESGPAQLHGVHVGSGLAVGCHADEPADASARRAGSTVFDAEADPEAARSLTVVPSPTPGLGVRERHVDPRTAEPVETAQGDERGEERREGAYRIATGSQQSSGTLVRR